MFRKQLGQLACVLGLGLLALPVQAGERKEFFLKYRLSRNITEEVGADGQYVEPTPARLGLTEEPKYHSRQPLYATARLGARKETYTLVLDHSKDQPLGYDILYVDANRDGRITADEKLVGELTNQGMVFGPVRLLIDCGREQCPQWFLFRLVEQQVRPESTADRVQIQHHLVVLNAGYYQGVVTFGDQKRLVAVVDADGNGLYNDCLREKDVASDRLLIDQNGDGKLDGGYQSDEAQPLGRIVAVGGRYWQLEVAPDGSSLAVKPLDRPLGTLLLGEGRFSFLVGSDRGVLRVHAEHGIAQLPAGTYRLQEGSYRLTGRNGKDWRFLFKANGESEGKIEVLAGRTTPMALGPPLLPKVTVTEDAGNQLALNLQLQGAGGELVTDVRVGPGEKPPPPRAKIIDATGREVALLDFHYG
jgi:hypothetical protein